MFCLSDDIMGKTAFGQIALSKMENTSENFRIFAAKWLGDPRKATVMKVDGAEFRRAEKGKNKGKLTIKVPGTAQTVYVTAEEIQRHTNEKAQPNETITT